jgi:urea transporter
MRKAAHFAYPRNSFRARLHARECFPGFLFRILTFFRMSIPAQANADSTALRTLLRSIGQIVLQPHAGTGACLLAALALSDLRLACAALIGATAANVCATLAGYADDAIRDGLAGFNGALAALAAFTFIGDLPTAIALALSAAGASAWLGAVLGPRLGRMGLSVYSMPCLIATWVWMALHAGAPATAISSAALPATDWLAAHAQWQVMRASAGVLSGVAQTEFASGGALAGLLVLAGIALSSPRAAAFAGAALASAVELACGTPLAAFDAGLAGFNGALVALATMTLGTRAAFCATILAAALHLAAVRCGLPGMTAPFVLASWCGHGFTRVISRRRRAAASPPASSEAQAPQTAQVRESAPRTLPSAEIR